MMTRGVSRVGRQRAQGGEDDPLLSVSLHVRKGQVNELDRLADAEPTSRAALVRKAIDQLLTPPQRP